MKYYFVILIPYILINYRAAISQVVFPTLNPNSCRTHEVTSGRCYPGLRCPGPTPIRGKPCSFQNGRVSVCCPIKSEPIILADKIVTAPRPALSCGKRGKIPIAFGIFSRSRLVRSANRLSKLPFKIDNGVAVVGGIESFRNSWPWMVLLGRRRGPSNVYFCSAVLLNENYVLTAAHCVLEPDPFFARFGEHNYKRRTPSRAPVDIKVKDVIFHPKYKVNRGYYDMALLRLSEPVIMRNEIQPVCLPWGDLANEDLINKKVTVTGWGSEEFGGRPSMKLREVVLQVFDPKVCEKSYSNLPDFVADYPEGMNKTTIVCAGEKTGGKDTCQGDSGGPMVAEGSNGLYNLVGIVSKGFGCGLKDFPGLYTPLRNYETLLWIKKIAF